MSNRKKPVGDPVKAELRRLINEARLACDHPNSQPSISHIMLGPKWFRRLNKRIIRCGFAEGLAVIIRRDVLKKQANGEPEPGITQHQLDLWAASLRGTVLDIGVPRVFVPSRDEFVLLAPDEITVDEIIEAGDYLVKKGQACIRRGNALLTLADQRRKK
jgi:hypothetical protein